jgi:hypothetical protein
MSYIITNRTREVEVATNSSCEGRFKLVAIKPGVGVRSETPWIKNLILNTGLVQLGIDSARAKCWVGTGTSTPLVTDTGLQSPLTSTSDRSGIGGGYGNSGEPDYYLWRRHAYRFAAGVAAGNLTEIGISSTNSVFLSRSLIKDEFGQPTSFTVLSDEVLDVVYEFRSYPNLSDLEYTISVAGQSHDLISRVSNVSYAYFSSLSSAISFSVSSSYYYMVHAEPIGSILSYPPGTASGAASAILQAYQNNSVSAVQINYGLSEGNFVGGIKSLSVGAPAMDYSHTGFQININPPIMKTSSHVLALNCQFSWGRR